MKRYAWLVLLVAMACRGHDGTTEGASDAGGGPHPFEAPVLVNAESPVRYPADAYRDRVEGTVVLRLYLTSNGAIVPESTRVAEGSGNRSLDSAALTAVSRMQFAPALRNGQPVATSFLQPVQFRRPASGGTPPGEVP